MLQEGVEWELRRESVLRLRRALMVPLWRWGRRSQGVEVFGGGLGVLGVAVAQDEPQGLH